MYSAAINVFPADNFKLIIDFDNGQKKLLDMRPYLDFGIFNRLKDPAKFNCVHVAFDTIEWDCGVDLDPEFVMHKSIPIDPAGA